MNSAIEARMRNWLPGYAARRLILLAMLFCLLVLPRSSRADVRGPLLGSGAEAAALMPQPNTRVSVSIGHHGFYPPNVCIRILQKLGPIESQVEVTEYGCHFSGTYEFDELNWRAVVRGNVATSITRYGRRGRVAKATYSTAAVNLEWRGQGSTTPFVQPTIGVPCYNIPLYCIYPAPSFGFSRDATAHGSIRFNGIRMNVRMPAGHPGQMRWFAIATAR